MMRTAAIKRPWTFGKTAGIHEFTASVFTSLVIRPLRNITASEPLTSRHPRDERSITPAPPSRTAAYSFDGIVWLTICQFTPRCLPGRYREPFHTRGLPPDVRKAAGFPLAGRLELGLS